MRFTVLSLSLLMAVGSAFADEESIKVEDLPKAVRSTVNKKFPEGKVVAASKEKEDGKTIYEVVVEDDGAKIDVALSAKGKLLEVEKAIDADKLPKEVTAAIEKRYPKAKIKKAEKVVKYEEDEDEGDDEEEKFFEVVVSVEGKESFEVKVSPKGKILKDEDEHEEKEEKSGKGKKKEKDDD